jgi:hypothetical protein
MVLSHQRQHGGFGEAHCEVKGRVVLLICLYQREIAALSAPLQTATRHRLC